jgi:hypothetical protein
MIWMDDANLLYAPPPNNSALQGGNQDFPHAGCLFISNASVEAYNITFRHHAAVRA